MKLRIEINLFLETVAHNQLSFPRTCQFFEINKRGCHVHYEYLLINITLVKPILSRFDIRNLTTKVI